MRCSVVGKRGLGRGLSALIATGEGVGGLKFEELPVSAIRPNSRQPRNSFPEAGIKELAASIREVGILQPLVVRSTPAGFELIAGERRLRAAREAGLERVPVLIRQAGETESMELALVENLQRENLSPLETAAAYQALMDGFELSKDQLADGRISEGHARAMLGLENEVQMTELALKVAEEKLSVRKTEELVREMLADPRASSRAAAERRATTPAQFNEASRLIHDAIELPVRVKSLKSGGKIEIRFREPQQLDAIVSLLTAQDGP